MRRRDDDHVGREFQQRGEARAGHGAALPRKGLRPRGVGVDAADEHVVAERLGALAPDQPAADDPDAQALRHRYSEPMQPWKSKPKRTSGAPASVRAARVAAASTV